MNLALPVVATAQSRTWDGVMAFVFLVALPAFLIPLIVFRYDKLQKSSIGTFFRWGGHWPWSFPASRFGALVGCAIALWLGAYVFLGDWTGIPSGAWWTSLITLILLVLVSAVHDFRVHKGLRGPTPQHPPASASLRKKRLRDR